MASREKQSYATGFVAVRGVVVRDGHPRSISAEEVVPGDVIWVESGERVPADVRLLNSQGLEIDESLLTGESLVVTKNSTWLGPTECTVGDRQNTAFPGSIVSRGRVNGVVVPPAAETMVGQLAKDVLTASGARPPLMERMDRFCRLQLYVMAAMGIDRLGPWCMAMHFEMVMFTSLVGGRHSRRIAYYHNGSPIHCYHEDSTTGRDCSATGCRGGPGQLHPDR